jgi:hypothetical protein
MPGNWASRFSARWGQCVGSSMMSAPAATALRARSAVSSGLVPARLAMSGTPAFFARGISSRNHCSAGSTAASTQFRNPFGTSA